SHSVDAPDGRSSSAVARRAGGHRAAGHAVAQPGCTRRRFPERGVRRVRGINPGRRPDATAGAMIVLARDIGAAVIRFILHLGRIALFAGAVARAALTPPRRVGLFISELFNLGVLSLVIICVCGVAVGMVLGLQGYNTLVRFGAEQALGAV